MRTSLKDNNEDLIKTKKHKNEDLNLSVISPHRELSPLGPTSMALRSSRLQSSVKTVQPGLLSRKACAAGSSFSMAQRDSAMPAW